MSKTEKPSSGRPSLTVSNVKFFGKPDVGISVVGGDADIKDCEFDIEGGKGISFEESSQPKKQPNKTLSDIAKGASGGVLATVIGKLTGLS